MIGARRGFTLWELVIVLTIMGIIAALTLPAFTSFGATEANQQADRVLQLLRDTRRLAIVRGSTVTLILDPESRHYRVDTMSLSGGMGPFVDATLTLENGTVLAADSARARFLFLPTGAAMADTLRIRGTIGQRLIVVDPWDGVARADSI